MSNSENNNKKRSRQITIVENLTRRPVEFLVNHNITPNILSYLGFLNSLLAAFFLGIGTLHNIWFGWLSPAFLIISGILDVLDGSVARKNGIDSKAGAFLDSNLDRLSDAVIIIGLIYGELLDFLLGFIILFLSIMISYIRSRAENEGVDMKGVGIMERGERILFLWFAIIFECWIYNFSALFTGIPFTLFFPTLILIYTFLLILTLGQRFIFTFKKLSKTEENNI
ncbi:MAG: CDP-alcohol phosphatidyltransferase family protein [Promethearchaeota archaeon]